MEMACRSQSFRGAALLWVTWWEIGLLRKVFGVSPFSGIVLRWYFDNKGGRQGIIMLMLFKIGSLITVYINYYLVIS